MCPIHEPTEHQSVGEEKRGERQCGLTLTIAIAGVGYVGSGSRTHDPLPHTLVKTQPALPTPPSVVLPTPGLPRLFCPRHLSSSEQPGQPTPVLEANAFLDKTVHQALRAPGFLKMAGALKNLTSSLMLSTALRRRKGRAIALA